MKQNNSENIYTIFPGTSQNLNITHLDSLSPPPTFVVNLSFFILCDLCNFARELPFSFLPPPLCSMFALLIALGKNRGQANYETPMGSCRSPFSRSGTFPVDFSIRFMNRIEERADWASGTAVPGRGGGGIAT